MSQARFTRIIAGLWFVVTLMAWPSSAWAEVALVGQGDEVLVLIPEGSELREIRAMVDGEGAVSLGMYGRVMVSGLSEEEAGVAVEAALSDYLSSTAGVTLRLEKRARQVLVTGRVKTPGAIRLAAGESLWDAVMRAGGPAQGAALDRVVLHGASPVTVDVRAHLSDGRALPEVRAGDTVFVPAGAGVTSEVGAAGALLSDADLAGKIFVLGAVRAPGLYERSEGETTAHALAAAGGPTASAALGHARLLTQAGAVHVDLLAVVMGEVAPGRLPSSAQGGLILYVPEQAKNGEESALSRAAVMGSVKRPGEYALRREASLTEVLARAGGPNDKADATKVTVVREEGGMTIASTYDVKEYLRDGGPVGMVTVRSGDVIHVPSRDDDGLRAVARFVSDVAIVAATFTLLLAL